MPNNITNQITFGSDAAARAAFQHMLHEMQAEGQPLGSIDFNKLIPMPDDLNIESGSRTDAGLELYTKFMAESAAVAQATMFAPKDKCSAVVGAHLEKWHEIEQKNQETWNLGEKAFQNIKKYGCPTWYEWCNEHWGTKWNAYGYHALNSKADTMVFFTAWGSVPKLIAALSKRYPDQEIVYRWADEDLGYNVGEMTFKNGEEIDSDIPLNSSRTAYEMAAEITGLDLAECNLFLTPDQSTYEYRDDPPEPVQPAPQKKKSKDRGQDR